MPRAARVVSLPVPVPVAISSLLAPQRPAGPHESLPTPSAAVLGPLPPTTPLHLALNWLALTDLPEYEPDFASRAAPALGGSSRAATRGAEVDPEADGSKGYGMGPPAAEEKGRTTGARAIVIAGSKEGYYKSLEEDDEDWMRDHGGDYEVLCGLNRIDMRQVRLRYCSTPKHLMLLLTLLSAQPDAEPGEPHVLGHPSGLVVLWDIAGMFMEEIAADENDVPLAHTGEGEGDTADQGAAAHGIPRAEKGFKQGVTISNYLDILSAARAAIEHLSTLDPASPPVQLVILEPNLDDTASLPIMPPPPAPPLPFETTSDAPPKPPPPLPAPPTPSKSKRVRIVDGIRWLFGADSIVSVVQRGPLDTGDEDLADAPTHEMRAAAYPEDVWLLRRRPCGRGEWASAAREEDGVEGDRGGVRWEWC